MVTIIIIIFCDNGDLLQKVPCCTQCPRLCSRPPLTYASTRDSWTLMGMSGPVSCGVIAPFSGILVHTRFGLCPPRVYLAVLCKLWQLSGGVNGDLLQESLCHNQVYCIESPCPFSSPLLTRTSSGDIQIQSISVSVGSLDPGAHKECLSALSMPGRYQV